MSVVAGEVELDMEPRETTGSPWLMSWRADTHSKVGDRRLIDIRAAVKETLGLDPDRPVVVVGHQPVIWHPGILAKFMAGDVIAQRSGATLVHLVIDGHRGSFGDLLWPSGDGLDSLHEATWTLFEADSDTPMHRQPPRHPSTAPTGVMLESVREGLHRCQQALETSAATPDAANQFAMAINQLMDPWVGARTTIMLSDLLDTDIGDSIVSEMRGDPQRCADAYNAGLGTDSTLGIHPLAGNGTAVELPLWVEQSAGGLRTAVVDDLNDQMHRCIPKALMTTALARLGLADLFIHGLGGWRYDMAMEAWVDQWLGLEPAPRVMMTARMRLPLLPEGSLSSRRSDVIADVRRRRHNPEAAANEQGPGPSKARSLAEIESEPRGSQSRWRAFHRMHEWIRCRVAAGDDDNEQNTLAALDALQVLADRGTWPFPLYEDAALAVLRSQVESRFD